MNCSTWSDFSLYIIFNEPSAKCLVLFPMSSAINTPSQTHVYTKRTCFSFKCSRAMFSYRLCKIQCLCFSQLNPGSQQARHPAFIIQIHDKLKNLSLVSIDNSLCPTLLYWTNLSFSYIIAVAVPRKSLVLRVSSR